MYPVCTGSAALQRRVRRGQTSAKPLRSKTSGALAIFFLPLLRGPKGPHYPHGRIHQLWNRSSPPPQPQAGITLSSAVLIFHLKVFLQSFPKTQTSDDSFRRRLAIDLQDQDQQCPYYVNRGTLRPSRTSGRDRAALEPRRIQQYLLPPDVGRVLNTHEQRKRRLPEFRPSAARTNLYPQISAPA